MITTQYLEEQNFIFFDSQNIDIIAYVVIDDITENRPDLISAILFNDMNLFVELCIFNGITDCMYIPKGTILRVPNKESFYENAKYKIFLENKNIKNTIKNNTIKQSIRNSYTKQNNSTYIF